MSELFSRIISFENLHAAYRRARKGKRYRSSILRFGCTREEQLCALRTALLRDVYRHGGYREFVVTDSKKRVIKAASFRDRVVHHAVCHVIEPMLDRGFIYDSYACRTGKGTHAAIRRVEQFIATLQSLAPHREIYCLQCDISKYFDSVHHELLMECLRRTIHDERTLTLLRDIITSVPQGIPIGNLTSQLFANAYLNVFDHFVKRELRARYYIRYMDDFLILRWEKFALHDDKERIARFLRERLRLTLHPRKAEVFPIRHGIDFLGYVVRAGKRSLRASTVRRFLKKLRWRERAVARGASTEQELYAMQMSWRGHARFARSYALMKRLGLIPYGTHE